MFLDGHSSLVQVNISYNSFSDPIPDKLMLFLNSESYPSSVYGNPGLCVTCFSSDGSNCSRNANLKSCDFKTTHQKG